MKFITGLLNDTLLSLGGVFFRVPHKLYELFFTFNQKADTTLLDESIQDEI